MKCFAASFLLLTACATADRPPASPPDPCALLSAEDVAAVQGAPFTAAQPSTHTSSSVTVAQCVYSLANPADSVTLEVTTPERPGGRAVRRLWEQRFGESEEREERERRERSKEGEQEERGRRNEGEREEGAHWLTVPGVGEEARWTGNRVSGALYVRTPSAILRISVGGAGSAEAKIAKAKALALRVCERLGLRPNARLR